MNDWSKTPFFRIAPVMCIGIVLGTNFPNSLFYLIGTFSSFLLFALTYWASNQQRFYTRWIEGVSLILFLFFIGAYNSSLAEEKIWEPWKKNKRISFTAEIIDTPEVKKSTIKCPVLIRGEGIPTSTKMILYIAQDKESRELKDGDLLLINNARCPQPPKVSQGEFDYQRYLHIKGFSGSLYIKQNEWGKWGVGKEFSISREARKMRKKILSQLEQWQLSDDEFGVLSALVLGEKRLLDKSIQNDYSATGASHILAVSGLHVGVVFFIFTWVLKWILRSMKWEKLRIVISLLFLWIYTFITGLSPSVVRASTMLTLAAFSTILHKHSSIYNTLFASAFLMLLYNPNYLYDISFQLSYLALLSILLFQNRIYRIAEFRSIPDKIWSLLSVSLAAQIGTLPLTLYCFKQFSNYFWFSGLIVVPLSGVIIYLTLALIIFGWVPYLSDLLATLVDWTLLGMNKSITWMSKLPYSTVVNIDFTEIDLTFLYLIVILLLGILTRKKFRYISSLLAVLFVYTIYRATYQFFL